MGRNNIPGTVRNCPPVHHNIAMGRAEENTNLLLRLKSGFGNELMDPTLARIQEIEKATNKLHEILFSEAAVEHATPEALETREFLIDTIERNLLMIPKDRYTDLLRFLKELKTPPKNPAEDPLDKVVAVTSKLEAFLKEVLYDMQKK